ncbi:hypothetical protein [Myxococcus sp. AM011]|uniref:hypothetical protein n=1 Tax=Myxococcus sp. AM011 TaxID=2745200 RepID=UPI001C3C2B50|nr:hypothetical protein [Myxococcus sp. AM011]
MLRMIERLEVIPQAELPWRVEPARRRVESWRVAKPIVVDFASKQSTVFRPSIAECVSADESGLQTQFDSLVAEWKNDVGIESSFVKRILHPAYQRIIGLGRPAIPLILRELRESPNHWGWALTSITGENPVPAEDAGRLRKIRDAWLRWGVSQGIVF